VTIARETPKRTTTIGIRRGRPRPGTRRPRPDVARGIVGDGEAPVARTACGDAARTATIATALGDPVRLQLVDVLRKHAGTVCVCELVRLFDLSQPWLLTSDPDSSV